MSLSERPLTVNDKILYAGETNHLEHPEVHLFGFSAAVSSQQEGANIIILPVPSQNPLSEANIINLKSSVALTEMMNAVSGNSQKPSEFPPIVYKTLLISGASQISEGLVEHNIPQSEKMAAFAGFLGEFYPGYSMIVCIFDGSKELKQFTLWAQYTPLRPDMFFLPTLVGDGVRIDLDAESLCDYWAIMSTRNMSSGVKLMHTDASSVDFNTYLPQKIIGRHFKGWYKNADTISSVDDIAAGLSDSIHRRPFIGIWHG